jgi:CheY-like chemotaxis protein
MLNGYRVLAVDEHEDTVELYVAVLGGLQADVRAASSGKAALGQVESSWVPDVLLVDRDLPDMTAAELARAVQEHAERRLGVVCTTADARPSSREAARAEDIAECLVKPIPLDALISAVVNAARMGDGANGASGIQKRLGQTRGDASKAMEREALKVEEQAIDARICELKEQVKLENTRRA